MVNEYKPNPRKAQEEEVYSPQWLALINKANSGVLRTHEQVCAWVTEATATPRYANKPHTRCHTVVIYDNPMQWGSRETMKELNQEFRDSIFSMFSRVKEQRFKIAYVPDASMSVQYLNTPIFSRQGICEKSIPAIRFVPMASLSINEIANVKNRENGKQPT